LLHRCGLYVGEAGEHVAINNFVSNATITFLVNFFLPMFVITSKDFSEVIKAAGELNLSSTDARGGGIVSLVLVVVDVIIFYTSYGLCGHNIMGAPRVVSC
jgi:hypothetical protein